MWIKDGREIPYGGGEGWGRKKDKRKFTAGDRRVKAIRRGYSNNHSYRRRRREEKTEKDDETRKEVGIVRDREIAKIER